MVDFTFVVTKTKHVEAKLQRGRGFAFASIVHNILLMRNTSLEQSTDDMPQCYIDLMRVQRRNEAVTLETDVHAAILDEDQWTLYAT